MSLRVSLRLCNDFHPVPTFCRQWEDNTRFIKSAQVSSIISMISTKNRIANFCHGAFNNHSRRRVRSHIGPVVGDGSKTDVDASFGRETRSHNCRSVRTLFIDQRIVLIRYNLRRAFVFGILLCLMKQRINEWPNSSF